MGADFETRFNAIEEDVSSWQGRADAWWDDAKRDVRTQVQAMRNRLEELKAKAPDAWEEAREGMARAFDELERGYRRAKGELA